MNWEPSAEKPYGVRTVVRTSVIRPEVEAEITLGDDYRQIIFTGDEEANNRRYPVPVDDVLAAMQWLLGLNNGRVITAASIAITSAPE